MKGFDVSGLEKTDNKYLEVANSKLAVQRLAGKECGDDLRGRFCVAELWRAWKLRGGAVQPRPHNPGSDERNVMVE